MAYDVLLVGCGNMGFAMLSGWVRDAKAMNFHVVEPNPELRERAASAGANAYGGLDELKGVSPKLVFLAVKPQMMPDVVPPYACFPDAVFVSIAAGVTVESLQAWLGSDVGIIRTMPNTPASISEGMHVSYANSHISAETRSLVDQLLSVSGETGWIEDEALMDAVTAISGSGPAYVFHFIECLTQAAVRLGLEPELAKKLALQTVAGAGLLARKSDTPPEVLRQQVTSPGGTTAAALDVFMGALGPLTEKATQAARDRGVELGKG